jgi:integrase
MVFGKSPALTPEEARKEARRLLASVALGGDPVGQRSHQRSIPTFSEISGAYLDEAAETARSRPLEARLRPRTIGNYRSLLKQHIAPHIGRLRLDEITKAEVLRLHSSVGRSKPATANRCLEFIGSIFRHASNLGVVEDGVNPTRGIRAYKEARRERFLSTEELARLGDAIRTSENGESGQSISALAAAALRVLVFTGARLREVLHAQWDQIDFERAVLIVAGKTGRRVIMLPPAALAVLHQLPRMGPFVFPGGGRENSERKPLSDLNRPWRLVRKIAQLEGVRLHDLRHSYASVAASSGSSLPMIGKLLGHSQPATTLRYSHLADDPLRHVANRTRLSSPQP